MTMCSDYHSINSVAARMCTRPSGTERVENPFRASKLLLSCDDMIKSPLDMRRVHQAGQSAESDEAVSAWLDLDLVAVR